MHGLQDRGLDLEVALLDEQGAHRGDDPGAGAEQLERLRVHEEVGRALAGARRRVAQRAERHRVQRLGLGAPARDDEARRAVARGARRGRDPHEVTAVDGAGEGRQRAASDDGRVDQQLHRGRPVDQGDEEDGTVVADLPHPPDDLDRSPHRPGARREHPDRRGRRATADRPRVGPGGTEAVEGGEPVAELVAAAWAGDDGVDRRLLEERDRAQIVDAEHLGRRASVRVGQEALRGPGGEEHLRQGDRVVVTEEAGQPGRLELLGGAVEPLELPEAVEEPEHRGVEPVERTRAEPVGVVEDPAEEAEVERDLPDPERRGAVEQPGHHELGDPARCARCAAHEVEREAAATPRHEGEQAHDIARRVGGGHVHDAGVRRVGGAAERHREAPLDAAVAPGVGPLRERGEGGGRDLGLPAHLDDEARVASPLDAVAHRRERGPAQVEAGGVEDRLVPEQQHLHARRRVGAGAALTRRERGRHPAELPRLRAPRVDGARPGARPADRVTGGERDPPDDPVGDGGAAVGGEDGRLVTTGGEVAERVARAVLGEQPPQGELALGRPPAARPCRGDEEEGGAEDGHRREHGHDVGHPGRDGAERSPTDTPEGREHLGDDGTQLRSRRPDGADEQPRDAHRDRAAADEGGGSHPPRAALEPAGELAPDPPQPPQRDDGHEHRRDVEPEPERAPALPQLVEGEPGAEQLDDPQGDAEQLEGGDEPEADPLAAQQGSCRQAEGDDRHDGRCDGHVDETERLLDTRRVRAVVTTDGEGERGDGGDGIRAGQEACGAVWRVLSPVKTTHVLTMDPESGRLLEVTSEAAGPRP